MGDSGRCAGHYSGAGHPHAWACLQIQCLTTRRKQKLKLRMIRSVKFYAYRPILRAWANPQDLTRRLCINLLLSVVLSAKYEFASSNTIWTTFAFNSGRIKRLFHRISIATIDAIECVFNVANSYLACWFIYWKQYETVKFDSLVKPWRAANCTKIVMTEMVT
jgi:hypothetical protein